MSVYLDVLSWGQASVGMMKIFSGNWKVVVHSVLGLESGCKMNRVL